MAKIKPKAQVEEPKPVVTSLPISTGDTPLVIDLPDGQKLVVGNLESGTVIEVATWRGTGRPDSRTSRLMLGVSSTDELQDQAQQSAGSTQTAESAKSLPEKLKVVLFNLLGKIASLRPRKRKSNSDTGDQREISKVDERDDEKFGTPSSTESLNSEFDSEIDDLLRSLNTDAFSSDIPVPIRSRSTAPSKSAIKKPTGSKKSKSSNSKKKNRR